MVTTQKTCGNCGGYGYTKHYTSLNLNDTRNTMYNKKVECEACGGKGYMEYATFTIEEAKAILKHCGLDKE